MNDLRQAAQQALEDTPWWEIADMPPPAKAPEPLSRDDQRLLLWQAMQQASKIGNPTDDKLVVEALHNAGFCIARIEL